MRIAVVGAGAIGAYWGAALQRGGAEVHLIARNEHLRAMRENGVRVLSPRGDFVAYPNATDDPAEIGPVDYVFLGLKAHSYPSCGPLVKPLLGEHTAVLAAQNGIPWWYFHELPGPYQRAPDRGRRSRWCHQRRAVTGAGHRLRGVSGHDDRGARSDPAPGGHPVLHR